MSIHQMWRGNMSLLKQEQATDIHALSIMLVYLCV